MSESFIKRPVMTTLVMLAILLFGIVAYRSLPVSDLPNVDFPTINVSAQLPGATPETMASAVALPLEKQFSTIAGISSMSSTSNTGNSSITIQFDLSRNIDAAAQDVQAAIANAASQLPPDMPTPPSYNKVNPADSPVIYLSLSSGTLPLSQVDEYAETLMAQQISMINGVAQVQVYGSQKYAVRVELDPRQLASRQIGIDEVANAVKAANVNLPTGVLHGTHQAFQVLANGQLTTAKQYEPIIIAYRNGAPVRLGDLGTVADGVENDKVASWFSGTRAIILAVQRQPGTNTVEVVDSVKALLPRFRAQMPAAVNLDILYDRSVSIRDSVSDVKFTLLLTMCLVIMVIFLFLRNVSATIIPSLALPMSVVGTFAVMYLLGYSLDNLSLMALTLSVGFVVDDAIVMLENIVRHMEAGEGVLHASISGSKEIGFTIVSMTLSLTAVFIPVLFMGGIVGRLLHEFAVTIGAAILVSGMVSLSLTPMLCSRFLKPHTAEQHGRLYEASERAFDGMLHAYDRSLGYVLRHRAATMVILGGLLVATVFMFRIMPTGFLPNEDTGQIFGFTEASQNISYDDMVRHQKEVANIINADPNIANAMSSLGRGAVAGATNSGTIFMRLKPRGERLSADQIVQELRPKLTTVPGIQVYLQILPPIRIGGMLTKSQYQFTLQSPNTDELYKYAPILVDKLRQQAGDVLQDVTTDLYVQSPQVRVNIDRDKASALGVSAAQVEDALFTSYGSRLISTIYAPSNEYRVIMELQPEYRGDPAALPMLYIRSSSGALVPLNAVASLTRTVGPLSINHLGQTPSVTVSFNTRPGISLGDAVARVQQIGSQVLPATITPSFQGTAQAFQSSFAGLGLLLAMAIAVIYIVLGILYESFIHPITILSGLPAAGFGALLTLLLFNRFGSGPWKMDLNLYAFVGIIMLVGIVKKNAIMMIDFALDAQRKEGKSAADAIYQGSLVRFRPIMMTTMAALMGTLPIALGFGAGSESRRPLGMAVVGGLVFSQLLTLFITPVVYTYMDTFQQRFGGKRKRSRTAEREAARELVLETHPRAQSASD